MSVFDEEIGEAPASRRKTAFEDPSVEPKHLLEERFRLLVESVNDYAILMLDPQGIVVTWNIGGERIYGYESQEIIGRHFSLFYPEQDVLARKCEMELEVSAKEGRLEDEGWRVRKDGRRFWANAIFTSLWQPDGKLAGFAKVTRDLTERRAAEEQRLVLGQAARERIQLLSQLAEALAGAQSIGEVGAIVVNLGVRFANADTCTLYLLDEEHHTLELVAEHGCNPQILRGIQHITRDSDNPTYAIGTGAAEAVWVENEQQYAAFFPTLATMRAAGTRAKAFWCVPLVAENRTIGMLGVGFHECQKFSPEEREFVSTFARQCAQAVARARTLQAERAAAALAEQLRASLDTTVRSIGDALIATDASGNITLMNPVAEAITGWTEIAARGRPLPEVFKIVNEHTRAVAPNPVEKVLESGKVVGLANHTVLISRDGSEIPIDDSGAPIRAREGSIEGVVLVFRDVSERKREESRRALLVTASTILAESLEYERTVTKVAELAVPRLADWCAVDLVVDNDRLPKRLAVAHVNPEKVHLAKELDAKYPPQMDSPTGVPNVLRTGRSELYREIPDELLVAGCIDDEHLRIARELRLHSAMVVPLSTRSGILGAMTFVYAESGRVYGNEDLQFAEELAHRCANAIENARVYSSEQQARHRADVANRAKDEFLAMVSHELRTPLNAIMGWAQLLASGQVDERRQKSALETIERNSVAMAQLIEDLLDMSRVISGKLRIEVQQVDVIEVIAAATESIRPAALAKGIDLVSLTDVDIKVPTLVGDPTRLQQIVWNLLSNAVKFTSPGGRVEVALRHSDSGVDIVVADTGKGITPDFLPRVFEPFRQADVNPTRSRSGLGLGLAITRQLVELHGGRINVHSDGEGHGSTFTVTLPTSAVTPSRDGKARMAPRFRVSTKGMDHPEHIRGLRVMVVEDDEDSRQLISTILEQCGCHVVTAQSVSDAMRKLESVHPDVILSDIGMPDQDGYDLIRMIRQLPRERGGDIPAAALTAYARAEDRRSLIRAGYSMHIPKPVEPAELVAVVSTLSRFVQRPMDTHEA